MSAVGAAASAERQECSRGYTPRGATANMLRRALQYVQSVVYAVSARWLFYRLLQDGTFADKHAYKAVFLPAVSRARKSFWEGWAPDTLADDTREAVYRGFGHADPAAWLKHDVCSRGCKLDRWDTQPYYIELWFEAAAMRGQFEHYAPHVTLRPFQGDPSIPFKWETAKHLGGMAEDYPGKPIVILYFGDLDEKGPEIPESAIADVRQWCATDFEFVRCGLNPEHVERFGLLENPDHPGAYQWEALSDGDASMLIEEHCGQYLDAAAFKAVAAQEAKASTRFQREMKPLIRRWQARA